MVYADSLNTASLISSMESGDFYASTGVTLQEVSLKNNILTIKIDPSPNVKYTIEFIGAPKGKEQTHVIKSVSENIAAIDLTDDYIFVRARITSDKKKDNPFKDGDVEMAWTQPVVFKP